MNAFITFFNNIETFDDLCEALKPLDKNSKGNYFECFASLFFKFDHRYRNTVKDCWLLNDLPDKIRLKLNIPKN